MNTIGLSKDKSMFTVELPPPPIQAPRLIIELDNDEDQAQGTAGNEDQVQGTAGNEDQAQGTAGNDQKAQGDNEKAQRNNEKAQGNNGDI